MNEPAAARPHMPDYGIVESAEGLLPWSWAEQRLAESPELWLATTGSAGRAHLMPVWAVWMDGSVWVSTGPRSRKGRNLQADPRCTLATADPRRPLVIEGTAEAVTDPGEIRRFTDAVNERFSVDYDVRFYLDNLVFRIRPERAFGLEEEHFTESPTRWSFPPPPGP
jgi:PPOX class probable F420-dependent enzyme